MMEKYNPTVKQITQHQEEETFRRLNKWQAEKIERLLAEGVLLCEALEDARDRLNELDCALMNRIRSERAFTKYGYVAEHGVERCNNALERVLGRRTHE